MSFAYGEEKSIIEHMDAIFENKKKYAIVGESGSGKSTLLKLVAGSLGCKGGTICYDGYEADRLADDFYYKNMSFVHQDIFLFNDSILNNITFYNDYADEEIQAALDAAELNSLIAAHAKGLSGSVGENGESLSGGEKQRISIARALIQNTAILLLDEFTSAIDNQTAYRIEKRLLDFDKMIISVTHKLNRELLQKYDEIIVLKNAAVLDRGSFDDLLERCEYFKGLYYLGNSQA
ncbi:MAG: ABC transporter ATP-binding protein [Eubacteriales bacterium]|nr:ABC transporter ATP-binding protein [Eubacteriales bacterium]